MAKTVEGDDGKPIATGGSAVNSPPPVWTTVRDNSKATPDAYQEEGNPNFISEFGSADSKGLAQLANMFKGGAGAKAKLNQAMSFMKGVSGTLSGGGSAIDKLRSLSSSLPGSLSQFGIDSNHQILSGLNKASNLVMNINQTYQRIRNTDFTNIHALTGLAQEITGSNFLSISEHITQAQYCSGLIKEMISSGIPGSFSMFKDLLSTNPHKAMVVKETYPEAVKQQDLSSISSMVDTVGRREFKRITSQENLSGNFINVLSKNWDESKERLDLSNTKKGREIKETLQKVNGEDWLYKERKDQLTINVKDYLYSNRRFSDLLGSNLLHSNQIRISHDSSTNSQILDRTKGNTQTQLDDEKFLLAMSLGTYFTPSAAIRYYFPLVYQEDQTITIG